MADNAAARPRTSATARLPGIGVMLAGQAGYQLRLLTRTPRALWLAIIVPAGVLALRLGHISHIGGHTAARSPVTALVAGLAVFGLLNTAYLTHASGLVSARQDGVLRRWRLTPLPAGGYFAGRIAATVLLADAGAAVVVLTGIAMAGLHVTGGTSLSLLAAFTIGSLTWAALGTAVTIVIPTAEAGFPLISLTYLPVIFLSGAFGSFPGEPNWLTTLIRYLPAQPLIEAVTGALHTAGGLAPLPGRDLAVLATWGAAGLAVSLRYFRWNPQRPAHGRHLPGRPDGPRLARRNMHPAILQQFAAEHINDMITKAGNWRQAHQARRARQPRTSRHITRPGRLHTRAEPKPPSAHTAVATAPPDGTLSHTADTNQSRELVLAEPGPTRFRNPRNRTT